MEINIKKIREGAQLPYKATPTSVGYDLFAAEDTVIRYGRNLVSTALAAEIPVNIAGIIKGRSGNNLKGMPVIPLPAWKGFDNPLTEEEYAATVMRVDIDVIDGTIDPDYRGEIGVILKSYHPNPVVITAGSRIAQILFVKTENIDQFNVVDELSKTERGEGGFGHSVI